MLAGRNKRAPYQSPDYYATLHARMAQPVTEASLAIECLQKSVPARDAAARAAAGDDARARCARAGCGCARGRRAA